MFGCLFVFVRLDKQLSRLEEKNHIHTRWDASAKEYKEVQLAFSLQKKEQLSAAIWAASRRRQFLLKLKAKYAGKMFHYLMFYKLLPIILSSRWPKNC